MFQRIKRDQTVVDNQISFEHLANLNERLDIILHTYEEHERYLDFEEIHWKVERFCGQLEVFTMKLNKKQGDLNQTEALYNEYKVGGKIHFRK